ncbi:acyltransferase family protein [Sphingomonas sp. Tas61C01]|uniref:acyltransferase family protein n=1 Tax=Sphingomonas sp. Tas61C01 TaxID=3458297 RepID=UPI00403E9449
MRIDRGARIDEARGIATLLVVTFHATRAEPNLAASLFYQANDALTLVRMPLFMIITGYLLGTRATTVSVGAALRSLRPWIVRVVWPLVTVTIVCVAILHGRGEPWPIARALLFGVWHLWYLQVLILLKIAFVTLDARWRPGAAPMIGLAIAAALLAWSGVAGRPTLFSLNRAVDLLPFLLFGAWIGRGSTALGPALLPYSLYAMAAVLVVQHLIAGADSDGWAPTSIPAMLVGAAAGLFVLDHAPQSAMLSLIGRYGFPVFLWHLPWFVAVEQVVIVPAGLSGMPGVGCRLVVGIVMPAVVARWAREWRVVSAIPIGLPAPRRRLPPRLDPTMSGYRSPLRRFASGMNHPC